MLEKIHILIALVAAVAVTILGLYQEITFFALTERLLIVIPIFFILGLFFRSYLKKILLPPEPEKTTPGEGESTEDIGELDDLALYDLENSKEGDGIDAFGGDGNDIGGFN